VSGHPLQPIPVRDRVEKGLGGGRRRAEPLGADDGQEFTSFPHLATCLAQNFTFRHPLLENPLVRR
jgi:hypothetical protein